MCIRRVRIRFRQPDPVHNRDVTFSHSIDFLLINLNILLFLTLSRQQFCGTTFRHYNVLFGVVAGYSIIVRYQDVALLLFPLWLYFVQNARVFKSRWKDLIVFLYGFSAGLWIAVRLLENSPWVVSDFGTFDGNFQSCCIQSDATPVDSNVILPLSWLFQLDAMVFTHHLVLCAVHPSKQTIWLRFFWRSSSFQAYYISSRSEWWNMGFSVRRCSGCSIFFMLGAAEIISACKTPPWCRGPMVNRIVYRSVVMAVSDQLLHEKRARVAFIPG